MPTLVLENVPADVYERLQELASINQRSVPVEAVQLQRQALPYAHPPEPQLPPCDLPVPGEKVTVMVRNGPPPLPDPPFLTEEEPAPCDLPLQPYKANP